MKVGKRGGEKWCTRVYTHILDQFLNICKQNKEGVVTTHTLFMYIKHNVDSLHALFLELYFSCVIVLIGLSSFFLEIDVKGSSWEQKNANFSLLYKKIDL